MMRHLCRLALVGLLAAAGSTPLFAAPASSLVANVAITTGVHAQVIIASPGPVGWYRGRYWDGQRYWNRRGWYAAHPGWRYGWGPGWRYRPGLVVGGGPAVGWYSGRYWDGRRYWNHDGWYAAHPGWRGGWGPGWHYRP